MKRVFLLPAVLVIVAGCGGGKKDESTIPLQLSRLPTSASCKSAGISTKAARAGTCAAGNTKITVANRTGKLRLTDYAVQLGGIRTTNQLGSRVASNFTPDGRFVVTTLEVKNTGSTPQRFDSNSKLAYLLVDGQEYNEIPGAEDELRGSFRTKSSVIEPGATASGTVVFDPPQEHAMHAGAGGSYLVFLNEEDTHNGLPRLGFRALAFIRLSK